MKRGLHQVFPKAAMKIAQSSFELPLKRGLRYVPKAAMKSAQDFLCAGIEAWIASGIPQAS
jgi:hypothetical protein